MPEMESPVEGPSLPFSEMVTGGLLMNLFQHIETVAHRLEILNRKKAEATRFYPSPNEVIDEYARVHYEGAERDKTVFKEGVAFGMVIVIQQKGGEGEEYREFLAWKKQKKEKERTTW